MTRSQRHVLLRAHDGADVPRRQKPLHAVAWCCEDGLERGRHQHVRRQNREIAETGARRATHQQRDRGRRRLEPDREEHDLALGLTLGDGERIER